MRAAGQTLTLGELYEVLGMPGLSGLAIPIRANGEPVLSFTATASGFEIETKETSLVPENILEFLEAVAFNRLTKARMVEIAAMLLDDLWNS